MRLFFFFLYLYFCLEREVEVVRGEINLRLLKASERQQKAVPETVAVRLVVREEEI